MSIFHHNGGAVCAMIGKECAAIATDHRLGVGFQLISCQRPKVYQMGPKVCVGVTGLSTDAQTVYEKLKFRIKMYTLREDREISPKALTAMASAMAYERRFGPYFSAPVICGLNDKNEPYVNGMDSLGARGDENAPFIVDGTCDESLMGMCEALWKPDMNPDELAAVLEKCMANSLNRDCLSGWGMTIYVITKDGVSTREVQGTRMD
eukprot:TRINITY_DN62212_c0_g1_i2.p1 TRINITY_DN62212_c0_g1~~TRINITY_DN62212_c0_g1_i2.p1  ORF type:complete len:207 (+),score=15.50 TRINITY_DN62212_c0_g1_i2:52-672(+)